MILVNHNRGLCRRLVGVATRHFTSTGRRDPESISGYAKMSQTPVGMKVLIDTGTGKLLNLDGESEAERLALTRKQIALFLRREMPIRFAHRARDLENIPIVGLSDMPSIKQVKEWYVRSFEEVVAVDLKSIEEGDGEPKLRDVLSEIYRRHQDTLVVVAKGLKEFKASKVGMEALGGKDLSDIQSIHDYFNRFFLSRIGIRILLGHYLEMGHEPPGYVGLICLETSPHDVALTAIEDASYMCERQYGDSPKVEVLGRIDLHFAYIPSHLYYILFELLKNSMRAVVEEHGIGTCPPIRVVIADGVNNEDVSIRISDLGGGISRTISSKVFSYLFTTAGTFDDEQDLEDFGRENPLAGLGYGLPISRGYCRYFGGDLTLMSMEGYGTDVYVHLPRIVSTHEPLV